ncbi:N-acetyltransferase [Paenibacillus xerothermodurans]|uniref:N-acetyltransferase n=2 Tax=Paenibacillus xerothermodurans TaxID=1977292 RepID=A0A2W1N6C3_PAEXE|nr:N-acetyltransferase [Paenibacillus xerothermodurans]
MCALHDSIFGEPELQIYHAELSGRPQRLVLVAADDGRVVGYKIGYQDRQNRFYSWLGAVHPEYRSQGIASELMSRQHAWCKSHGYHVVRTQTKNKWRNMLILNIRHGFDIIGTFTDDQGETKIILEKRLL